MDESRTIDKVVYYYSRKRELKTRPIYECRCKERLQSKAEESTRLAYTGKVISGTQVDLKFFSSQVYGPKDPFFFSYGPRMQLKHTISVFGYMRAGSEASTGRPTGPSLNLTNSL
jgi:hypothetical protein